jgi:hypothetical protein
MMRIAREAFHVLRIVCTLDVYRIPRRLEIVLGYILFAMMLQC